MPTDAPFDPCKQWLGVDAVDLGNARLVLGVSRQETDPSVVVRAAEARLNLLRTISPGPFEMARAGLIKRVEEARDRLLAEIATSPPRPMSAAAVTFAMPTPPSQAAGVASGPPSMRQGLAPAVPPAVPPAMPSMVPPVPPAVPGGGVEKIAIRTTVYRKKTPVAGVALTVLALCGVAGGLLYYTVYEKPKGEKSSKSAKSGERHPDPSAPPTDPATATRQTPRNVAKDDETPGESETDRSEPAIKPQPRRTRRRPRPDANAAEQGDAADEGEELAAPVSTPMQKPAVAMAVKQMPEQMPAKTPMKMPVAEKPADALPAKPIPEKDSRLDATLAEALDALRRQEDDAVNKALAAASTQAGGKEATQRVDGWKLLAGYYKGFLEYREKALAAVKPGDEYEFKNQTVVVVKVDDEKFTYHTPDGDKAVSRDKIPAGISLAIVTQWFDANPAKDLYVGAYHLAKPESDPNRAREHWEQALAAGADASRLLPLLDDPVFAKSE